MKHSGEMPREHGVYREILMTAIELAEPAELRTFALFACVGATEPIIPDGAGRYDVPKFLMAAAAHPELGAMLERGMQQVQSDYFARAATDDMRATVTKAFNSLASEIDRLRRALGNEVQS